jgi:hypothetical protein
LLPARFAWLSRNFAIVFVRETSFAATAFVSGAFTARTAIAAFILITVAATAVAATAAAWSARSAPACFFGARFVHFDISATHIFAVESCDCSCRFGVVDHFDEAETAGFSGFAIHGDVNASKLAKGFEESFQISGGGLEAHVADKQVLHTVSLRTNFLGEAV